jgi:hypothetical protein
MRQKSRGVFAPVAALAFNAKQRDACRDFLAHRSEDTEALPIVDEAQLLMAADGRLVESGYRFNAVGFSALATALSPGLNSVFNDLSGESRRTPATKDTTAAAAGVYNTVLKAKFESLRERTLLLNHREKSIEGFLGLEHRMMDNVVFFDLVAEEIASRQDTAEFHRAELIGRELRLYYLDTRTKRSTVHTDPSHTFAAGWYFSNREDTGVAMRATTCLFTKFGAATEPRSPETSVRHTGADLSGRAGVLIAKCVGRTLNMDDVTTAVRRLAGISLGFSSSKKAVEASTKKLVEYLVRFKVNREEAKHICKNAAIVGSDLVPRSLIDAYDPKILEARSLYDLFCSTLRHAKNQYHVTRDLLQGAAMQMLNIEGMQK